MSTFEFDGEKYKQSSKHQKEWGSSLISEMELKGNEMILDLGCGDGVLTEQLSLLVPEGKIIGIDASFGMIQTAKKLEKDNLSFICMDITDMDFINDFDIIYSNATLHWVKNHEELLKNTLLALKSYGTIRWNFAGDGNCSNFFEIIKSVINNNYKKYFFNFQWPWYMPSSEEYEKLIAKAGFSSFLVELENKDRYFSNEDEMIKWIDQPSIVPFIQCIPDNKKENFRNIVIKRMIEKTKEADGRCFETFRRIDVKAAK
ncbi:MAG: methyltransferase domain-containing protein [Methanobacteriaceae archaeon]|jgi:trans-aconitate methyltransferase|nr:methyltransferase domain-containing protein [Candidatus Methanorudis spinitermitis]